MDRRTVFFVSDGTGITAQMLGHSLMTQFEGVEFNQVTLPFVDSTEKAEECVARIGAELGQRPAIVFSTLVNNDVREVVRRANALVIDFFETFIDPLEAGPGRQVEPYDRALAQRHGQEGIRRNASRRSTSPWRTTTARRTAN